MYIDKAYVASNTQHQYIKDLCASESTTIDEAIKKAEEKINEFVGQEFKPVTETTISMNGNGLDILVMPFHIVNTTSVTIDDEPRQNLESRDYHVLLIDDGVFDKGFKNVIINGKFGWEEVPDVVKIAAKDLVEHYILANADEHAQIAFHGPLKSENIEGTSYSVKDGQNYAVEIINTILAPLNNKKYMFRKKWRVEVV